MFSQNINEEITRTIDSNIKPKMFIASSGRARPIAEELIKKLEDSAELVPWWTAFDSGVSTLTQLLELAGDCDFAAVLLTADDVVIKESQATVAPQTEQQRAHDKTRVARDNCIFELGLFTGALGLDPRRAFILTSLSKLDLPTDFQEITHLRVAELPVGTPGDASYDQAKARFDDLIGAASGRIKTTISRLKFCYDRPKRLKLIPGNHLMRLEKLTLEGGNIKNEYRVNVIVHSAQPVEKDREFAKIVQRNMTEEVTYIYFFEADQESRRELPALLRTLAIANLETDSGTLNVDFWKEEMIRTPENKRRVHDNLNNMKGHLRIFLLENTEQVQFCIHNANLDNDAICYLRYAPQKFVEWCSEEPATRMAKKLISKGEPKLAEATHIFNGSTTFDLFGTDLSKQNFRQDLWKEIKALFKDEFHQELEQACFGNKFYSGPTQSTAPQRNWWSRLRGK